MRSTIRRGTVLLLALCGTLVLAPVQGQAAADKCLAGASATGDLADLSGARDAVEKFCDCAAYDGTPPNKTHGKFVSCARGIIATRAKAGKLRSQCKGVAIGTYAKSTCGLPSTPGNDKVPCVKKVVAGGKVTCAIKPQLKCTTPSSGAYTQVACPLSFFCLDAADSSGNMQIDPADSGACTNTAGPILGVTADIESGAQPPNTPGSPGVLMPANLQTQFGKKPFSLNKARYTRYRYARLRTAPDAVLILVPGFEGGAGTFKILAENVIRRMQNDFGKVVEVWGFDRRTNQLEDTAGLDVAELYEDPQIGLDWLFGAELGMKRSAAIKRRAVFYNAHEDLPFFANWTNLVFSQDIDAVVDAARAWAKNSNVFLGGHSAGTGFTARYASTDFDLTGAGPAMPGYAKLRGLVLLEGGGGTTAGAAAITDDTLDRIIDKFDGGLYAAVRDYTPACVDGSSCTSDSQCVGKGQGKCTSSTTAYSSSSTLNPRIFASSEPSAIQGIADPNTGLNILRVDQASTPDNNAIAKVPDLAILANPILFPAAATVEAAIGSFVDDDGLVAAAASFVSTSVGGPGPVVGGITTWLDITQSALFPSCPGAGCLTPYMGPAPTTLPATKWGQQKEVTSFDRLLTTFYSSGTNFTDWYYPVAGPSTTSVAGQCSGNPGTCVAGNVGAACSGGNQSAADATCSQSISLDSTKLSADPPDGRGRRDIENLTQCEAINIPVIAFGASNGLTPVPGSYVPFATSIGLCTAPSCDGLTERVVDAADPNPAFPTFGDIAGGFEVYISEGFAHVDIVTAEDDANNNVVTPLAAFINRNAQ